MKLIRIALAVLLFATACSVQLLPPQSKCPGSIVQNPQFTNGINVVGNGSMPPSTIANWTAAFVTPQISAAAGCPNPGFIAMWGNQVVGEAIGQTLATPLVAGKRYRFSACVRFVSTPGQTFVRFRVRASNGPLVTYTTPGAQIGISSNIISTGWTTITLPDWIATGAFNTITINPQNNSSVNAPNAVAWGHIDNICLREIVATIPCALDPGMINAQNTFVRAAMLAQTFTATASGNLTKITHGLQQLSGSAPSYQLMITTTAGGVPTWPASTTGILYQNSNVTTFATSGIVNGVVAIPALQQPALNAGTLYALILVPNGTGSMAWRGNTSAISYPNGSAYELNGNSWNVPSTGPKDHGFVLDGLCF
jgi:hypothetical protein